MDFINQVFQRADLQKIVNYLLTGGDMEQTDPRPYYNRILDAEKRLSEVLAQQISDETTREEVSQAIYECFGVYQTTYMEIGMAVAALLHRQIEEKVKDTQF